MPFVHGRGGQDKEENISILLGISSSIASGLVDMSSEDSSSSSSVSVLLILNSGD